MIIEDPHRATYAERQIISVYNGEIRDPSTVQYPFMTIHMELEQYSLLNVSMPEFLIGQQFDIITVSWKDECLCPEDQGEHDWDKNTCEVEEPAREICGDFIFHLMPHEFFRFYHMRLGNDDDD